MDYDAAVTRLYPTPSAERRLRGLYLDIPLEPADWPAGRLLLYTNYVTSLDGRIAVEPGLDSPSGVPSATANPRDWRLFQELAARADVLVTGGRYLRQLRDGTAQDVLPVGKQERFADIRQWRLEQGLPAQPDVAVVSASLDFPVPPSLLAEGRRVLVLAPTSAPPARLEAIRETGAELRVTADQGAVSGAEIRRVLAEAGYRRAYSVTGPQVLHTLVVDGSLDTLFLTMAHRLVGGEQYASVAEGPLLRPAAKLALRHLYYDPHAPEGAGQLLSCYDIAETPRRP